METLRLIEWKDGSIINLNHITAVQYQYEEKNHVEGGVRDELGFIQRWAKIKVDLLNGKTVTLYDEDALTLWDIIQASALRLVE